MDDFVVHACEQSLRFSTAASWDELSEKIRMQFSFNVGVMVEGLGLTKAEGYDELKKVCLGESSLRTFHDHVRGLLVARNIVVNEENINKPFIQ